MGTVLTVNYGPFDIPNQYTDRYRGGARNWPVFLEEWLRSYWRNPAQLFPAGRPQPTYACPCCQFNGRFVEAKRGGTAAFRCPNCSSRPRDRQIQLILDLLAFDFSGKRILHFAPEWPLFRKLRNEPGYIGGDIIKRRNANAIVDITNIDYPDGHFDVLICNHVLEHVPDDATALREASRVLGTDGIGIISVPIDRDNPTWRPPADMSPQEVEKRCGWDHKRLYGNDFADLLESYGFSVLAVEFTDSVRDHFRLFLEPMFLVAKGAGSERLLQLSTRLSTATAVSDT